MECKGFWPLWDKTTPSLYIRGSQSIEVSYWSKTKSICCLPSPNPIYSNPSICCSTTFYGVCGCSTWPYQPCKILVGLQSPTGSFLGSIPRFFSKADRLSRFFLPRHDSIFEWSEWSSCNLGVLAFLTWKRYLRQQFVMDGVYMWTLHMWCVENNQVCLHISHACFHTRYLPSTYITTWTYNSEQLVRIDCLKLLWWRIQPSPKRKPEVMMAGINK